MAGEPTTPSAPVPTGVGGTPEPIAAASPAPAPAAPSEPAAAAPAAPAAEPAAPAAAEPAAPASEPTLLEKFDAEQAAKAAKAAKPEIKPESKPAAASPPADPKAATDGTTPGPEKLDHSPAPEAVAYEYTLPETIKMDDAVKGTFHTALDAFRADPTKGAQGLIDLHNQQMTAYAENLAREQVRVFNETRKSWQTEVMADPELGGAGHQTTMGAVARMRDMLVPEKHRESFNTFLKVTGAGDHPEFLRLLHNAARLYDEAPMPPPGAKPPANLGKAPGRGLRGMYKTNGQGRS